MKNSYYVIAIILIFLSHSILGQSTIRGKLTDQNGQALIYANVLLQNAKDSTFLKGEIADIKIYFTLSPENNPLIQEYHISLVNR